MFDAVELFKIKNKKDQANSTEKVPIQESFRICSRLITQKDVLLLEQVTGQMGRVFQEMTQEKCFSSSQTPNI